MLASASDYHTFHKFTPGGRKQAAQTYLKAVQTALDAGIRPRLHLEDATRAPLDFMRPFVAAVMAMCAPYGEALRPKFRVCDTMGLGLPYDDVALPRSVPRLIRALRELGLDLRTWSSTPTTIPSWSWRTAWRRSAPDAPSSTARSGQGRAHRQRAAGGRAAAPARDGLLRRERQPDFTALNELADLYAQMGEPVPPKYPLYGRDAHRTRAGVHADGLNKFWWMYAPFNVPELLGPAAGGLADQRQRRSRA